MRTRYEKWVNRLMFVSGCILLLTIIIPHHHHEDGSTCIFWLDNEHETDRCGGEDDHHHSCEYNGHMIVFHSTLLQKHASETHDDLALLLIPLHTLFDYINPLLLIPDDRMVDSAEDIRPESFHCAWMSAATGFRAPPCC
jgi:hypothetical protein